MSRLMQPIGAEQVFTSSPSDLETLSLHHKLTTFPRLLPSFQHSEVYEKEVSFKKKWISLYPNFKFSTRISTILNPFYKELLVFPSVLTGTGMATMHV